MESTDAQRNMGLKARVTAHRGVLCMETLVSESEKDVCTLTDRPGRIGQVIHDTGRHLGLSIEALAVMERIGRGPDMIGEVDFFADAHGKTHFCWLGPMKAMHKPHATSGSKTYVVPRPGQYVLVPNDVPDDARAVIDEIEDAAEQARGAAVRDGEVYDKYRVTRTDGRDDPNAIYFVLRVDRVDDPWDMLCRWTLGKMADRLMADGDPEKNKFGMGIDRFIRQAPLRRGGN